MLRQGLLFYICLLLAGSGLATDEQTTDRQALSRQADDLLATARSHSRNHEYKLAIASFQAANAFYRRVDDQSGVQSTLDRIATHYLLLADYAQALDYATQSVRLAERLGDKARLGQAHYTLAFIYRDLKEYDLAMKDFQEAERCAEQAGDIEQRALSLNEIGNVLARRNDLDGALRYKQQALEMAKKSGDQYVISACLHDLGLVFQEKMQYREALRCFSEALELDRKDNQPREESISLINIGALHLQLGQHKEAIKRLEEALPVAQKFDLKSETAQILELLAESHSQLGHSEKAFEFLKKANVVRDEIFDAEKAKRVTEIQTAYETERKERENEILKRDNKIKDLDLARKRGQTNLLLIVAILVAIVAVALFNSNRIKSRTNQALAEANLAVNAQKAALDEANRLLDTLARTDYLTGLPNRLAAAEPLAELTAGGPDVFRPFVLVLGDIDDFKTVNDRFGHHVGDLALMELARKLRESLRTDDSVARWGGEEFLILLPDTDAEAGAAVATRIHSEISNLVIESEGHEIRLTITFGVVSCEDPRVSVEEYLKAADRALYKGKSLGKNRVVISPRFPSTQLDLPIHKAV